MVNAVYSYLAHMQQKNRTSNSLTRRSIHEQSELKQIYNNIINLNMRTPLYRIRLTPDDQNYLVGIKDASLELHRVIYDLKENEDTSVFSYKKAFSENEKSVTVNIITEDYDMLPSPFSIKVNSLATKQINQSIPLYANGVGPSEGSYHFTIEVEDNTYEFQFHIAYNARNHEIESKLVDFINQSNIGLKATLKTIGDDDKVMLLLESDSTGSPEGLIFQFKDIEKPGNRMGIVEFYDLNNVISYPHNAKFELDSERKESLSNHFTLNHALEINLNKKSDQEFTIGYEPDVDKIIEGVANVISSYNHLIQLAHDYPGSPAVSKKLIHDVCFSAKSNTSTLESCGLIIEKTGALRLDTSLAMSAIKEGDMENLFTSSTFVPTLMNKLERISLNPIEYIDKTIVAYPNTLKPRIGTSYLTSIYSGILFNYYC